MSMISTKINLTQFKHTVMKLQGKTGLVECIVIPIDANNFYRGEKGIYVDLVGFELNEKRDNQTHLVKQSLPRELFDKMSDEQKKEMPIVGSHKVFGYREPEPVKEDISVPDYFVGNEPNDLPF